VWRCYRPVYIALNTAVAFWAFEAFIIAVTLVNCIFLTIGSAK
jgi:hypothetical protein